MLTALALGAFAATTTPLPTAPSAAYLCVKAAATADDAPWWGATTAVGTAGGGTEYLPDAGSCFDYGAVVVTTADPTVRAWYRLAGLARAADAIWAWSGWPGGSTLMAEQMEEGDRRRQLVQLGDGYELWEGGSLLLTVAGPRSPDGWVLDPATGDVLVTFPDGRAFVVAGITDPHVPQWF